MRVIMDDDGHARCLRLGSVVPSPVGQSEE